MRPSFSELNIIDIDQAHMLGRIHSTVTGSAVDGPGMRYVIFMQGCQFQCKYCHNRDTWDMDAGKLYSVKELVEDILGYVSFLDKCGGGVTVSGGEALLQPEFVAMLFSQLKKLNLHTCLDTNGYVTHHIHAETLDSILDSTDLVLLDIKHMNNEKHRWLTGVCNEYTLKFAEYLNHTNRATRVRYVVVPGVTDDIADIRKLAEFIQPMKNVERIELLPYHKLGVSKWKLFESVYPLENTPVPDESFMQDIKTVLEKEYGLRVLL